MSEQPFISVLGVTKRYGRRRALDNISLNIGKGEIFGVIGPNGAGKSTLISLLATVNKPESGDILVDGGSIVKNPDAIRERIGYVPQDIALYPMLSAYDNMDFWAGIYGLKGESKKRRILAVLEYLRLADRARDRVGTFSGGMKRRLNIAASLLHKPEILIMDEPTAGVDVLSRTTIAEMIKSLKRSGCTVIITSHDIDELQLLCDRLAVMNKGSMIHTGSLSDILKRTGVESLEALMLNLEAT
jgi:ABC-2 type transport system ATP-binding protein